MTHLYSKSFNFEHFLEGAAFGCVDGSTIRVLCNDRKTEDAGAYPIVALVDRGNGAEGLLCYNKKGEATSAIGSYFPTNDLVMIPLGFCEGIPVYTGDVLYHKGYPTIPYKVKACDQLAWDNHIWRTLPLVTPDWKQTFFPHYVDGVVQHIISLAAGGGYPYYAYNGVIYDTNTRVAIGRFE